MSPGSFNPTGDHFPTRNTPSLNPSRFVFQVKENNMKHLLKFDEN